MNDDDDDDDDQCGYHISTHATSIYVEYWQRDDALIYTLVVVSIFVFTGLIFGIYDLLVQYRQRLVETTALKTQTTVAVLEDMVRQRTGKLEETNQQLELANKSIKQASALQLQVSVLSSMNE